MTKLLKVKDALKKINGLSIKSAESQIEIGMVLKGLKDQIKELKTDIDKKKAEVEYLEFIEQLPFNKTVANKFVQIASDELIVANKSICPIAYNALYELRGRTKEDWEVFKTGIGKDGKKLRFAPLNNYTTISEAQMLKNAVIRTDTNKVSDEEVKKTIDDIKEMNGTKKKEEARKNAPTLKVDTETEEPKKDDAPKDIAPKVTEFSKEVDADASETKVIKLMELIKVEGDAVNATDTDKVNLQKLSNFIASLKFSDAVKVDESGLYFANDLIDPDDEMSLVA